MKSALLYAMMLGGIFKGSKGEDPPAVIPSAKIEQKPVVEQLSKRKIQYMKGKKTRKNRGRNRNG